MRALLRLAQDDPQAATVALAPVLDESAPVGWRSWLVEAFLLEAIARDALGDRAAAGRTLERAFDLAEPEGALLWFLRHPAPGLLERHARQGTAHAALVARIMDLQAGNTPAPQAAPRPLLDPLSGSEIRVLRYLPTHLSAPESCPSRRAPSRPTCATCTPSSASTAGPRRSSPPAPWACSHPPRAHAESVAAAAKQTSQPSAGSVG
jgi:hypothetical protein